MTDEDRSVFAKLAEDIAASTVEAAPAVVALPPAVAAAPVGHEPNKPLPTTRARVDSQLSILRAFAVASGKDRLPVSNKKVADIADVSVSTVSSCNAFFADIKLIENAGGRGYVPAPFVFDFDRAHAWGDVTAASKLEPVFREAWFWEALSGRLSFRQLSEESAVQVLAEESEAGPGYKLQLTLIIDFLVAVGLVARDNGLLRKVDRADRHPEPAAQTKQSPANPVPVATPAPEKPAEAPAPAVGVVLANAMSITMNLAVPMDRLSRLNDPEKVQAFFREWANLVNAKAAIERMMESEL